MLVALTLGACGVGIGGDPDQHAVIKDAPDVDAAPNDLDAPIAIDAPPDARPCTDGATNDDSTGHCFEFFPTPALEFAAAETACEALGAHLAIITAQAEQDAIAGLIGTTTAYLGATDQVTEGTFLWVDMTPLTFTNFNTGEPNNGAGTHQEDCLVMRGDKNFQWDDRPCLDEAGAGTTPTKYPYVCER